MKGSRQLELLADIELLECWRNGDGLAYDVLFKRYYNTLCQYARHRVKDGMLAEELVMDVFLRVWKKDGDISVDTDLRPYLLRSIKNAIFNHYRRSVPQMLELDELPERQAPQSPQADTLLMDQEMQAVYQETITRLSPKRREVFELSRGENLTYPEIARKLGISENTVENYMAASLAFFRRELRKYLDITNFISLIFFYLFFFR